MKAAIRDSGLALEDIDYINAHATSTPLGDKIESKVIRRMFGKQADKIFVNSNKGNVGHLLGAAGAVESIFSILSMNKVVFFLLPTQKGLIPPTLNLETTDEDLDLNYVKKHAIEVKTLRAVLKNSFGFGGTNASLVFKAFNNT